MFDKPAHSWSMKYLVWGGLGSGGVGGGRVGKAVGLSPAHLRPIAEKQGKQGHLASKTDVRRIDAGRHRHIR